MNKTGFLLLAGLLLWSIDGAAQYTPTSVETIVTNPDKFADAAVEISGTVTLYTGAASSSTGHYLLKGSTGAAIRVNTTDGSPELKKRYRVTGIVYLDPMTRVPFVSEKGRVREDTEVALAGGEAPESDFSWEWLPWALAALFLLVLAGVFALVMRKRRRHASEKKAAEVSPLPVAEGVQEPAPAQAAVQVQAQVPAEQPAEPVPDLKTVKIALPSPKTMRYVPGELVVLSGEDKGKSFKIAGFPTPEGSVVTIGREPVNGERAYAHIQIEERFHTVSRKQAEFIWKEKKLFVKNLSDTNPTQVNGVELKNGKMVQLKPGSVVRTGELEFEYRV
jgi:hypothetical protein